MYGRSKKKRVSFKRFCYSLEILRLWMLSLFAECRDITDTQRNHSLCVARDKYFHSTTQIIVNGIYIYTKTTHQQRQQQQKENNKTQTDICIWYMYSINRNNVQILLQIHVHRVHIFQRRRKKKNVASCCFDCRFFSLIRIALLEGDCFCFALLACTHSYATIINTLNILLKNTQTHQTNSHNRPRLYVSIQWREWETESARPCVCVSLKI